MKEAHALAYFLAPSDHSLGDVKFYVEFPRSQMQLQLCRLKPIGKIRPLPTKFERAEAFDPLQALAKTWDRTWTSVIWRT